MLTIHSAEMSRPFNCSTLIRCLSSYYANMSPNTVLPHSQLCRKISIFVNNDKLLDVSFLFRFLFFHFVS